MTVKAASPLHHSARPDTWWAWMCRFTSLNLVEIGLWSWVLLLITLPLLAFSGLPDQRLEEVWVELHGHLLIETFCGFVALMITGMVLTVGYKRRNPSFKLFALAFLFMGTFDILHAWTDPFEDPIRFVLFHSLSTVLGGAFILWGVLILDAPKRTPRRFTRGDLIMLAGGLALVVAVAALYRAFIPRLLSYHANDFGFSADNHTLHYLAGLLYALAAVAFYRYFRRHGEILALVIASLLVLFAQSAYLFSFSSMWNLTWWTWHGVKLVFYLGVMVTVFISYTLALRTIKHSRVVLTRANGKLNRSQEAIQRINKELKIRNRMAQDAMSSLDLDNAMDVVAKAIRQLSGLGSCELILNVPHDEVDEFERRGPLLSQRWSVRPRKHEVGCLGGTCQSVKTSHARVFECGHKDEFGRTSVCLSLSASGEQIGFLRLVADDPGAIQREMGSLRTLAVEVGAIVHNALQYHDLQEANGFRLAMLRVSTLLTSTLKLDEVVESVCKESAALLESDGALVWLPGKEVDSFSLVARWFGQQPVDGDAERDAWCRDGKLCARLLKDIDGEFQARDIVWQDESHLAAFTRPTNFPWEAIALFPLVDGVKLIGVMMLVRRNKVRYSAATLAKGELLAGQVRIAINNARSYELLAESNQQLKLAEEHKLRAERLAGLGQMAASVAHEVLNPLTAITNCLAVLKTDHIEGSRGQAALGIIQDEVERLTNLTSNFLTFGKPRAITRKPLVIEAAMHRMGLALERHISQEELSIQVEVSTPASTTQVLFDSDGLDTVLWNLLLNATQAISGAGRIHLCLRMYSDHSLISVADTGKGIPPMELLRIFEPFYSNRSLGSGLGLAIVQRTVQDWGGRIRIRSQVGQGTAFFLRVPLLYRESHEHKHEDREAA
jgi:signal transduction histidine kinase